MYSEKIMLIFACLLTNIHYIHSIDALFVRNQHADSLNTLSSKTITTIINGRSTSNRNFYLRTRQLGDYVPSCGGVILENHWVLTAAECVKGRGSKRISVSLLYVEILGFDPTNTFLSSAYLIRDILYTENPQVAERNENVLALLRLKHIINDIAQSIPICDRAARQGDLIGMCGMGSVSRTVKKYPKVLHEAIFSLNFLKKGFIPVVDPLEFCDPEDICTDKINDANSCLNDAGSPVYQFQCRVDENGVAIREPKCLYGIVKPIATESRDQSGEYIGCKGEETFVNVTHVRSQIRHLMENYIL